jgi:hypothetical protein
MRKEVDSDVDEVERKRRTTGSYKGDEEDR